MQLTDEQKKQLELELDNFARLDRTETKRQRLIRACVAYWEKLYPTRVENWDKDMAEYRKTKRTEFSEFEKGAQLEMRHILSIPGNKEVNGKQTMGLLDLMDEIMSIFEENPDRTEAGRLFADWDERSWFWRQFPRYRVSARL